MNRLRTSQGRFTLLELILVMVLLTIAAAIAAPRLSGFFQGRQLDDEARRLWALTRFAQEQAVLEAVPMRVWVDTEAGEYGAEAVPGYGCSVPERIFPIPAHIVILNEDGGQPAPGEMSFTWWPDGTVSSATAAAVVLQDGRYPERQRRLVRRAPLPIFVLEQRTEPAS